MRNSIIFQKCILEIPICKYQAFCLELKNKMPDISDFNIFKNEEYCDFFYKTTEKIFEEEINQIILLINDKNIGIAACDIPEIDNYDKSTNALYGVAIIMGIFNKIGIPNIDPINHLPFAIHSASYSHGDKLDKNAVNYYTPEIKLGFHNDGLLSHKKIEIPQHIVVYNLYIAYQRPGHFMWIPSMSWQKFAMYQNIAKNENMQVTINLTPSYYLDNKGSIKNTLSDLIRLPLCAPNEKGDYRFFLNGQVLVENNSQKQVDFIKSIRHSLENESEIIYIPQKERRAFFFKNTMGFHARDVFQDPIEGVDLTRVFLRIVDLNTEILLRH